MLSLQPYRVPFDIGGAYGHRSRSIPTFTPVCMNQSIAGYGPIGEARYCVLRACPSHTQSGTESASHNTSATCMPRHQPQHKVPPADMHAALLYILNYHELSSISPQLPSPPSQSQTPHNECAHAPELSACHSCMPRRHVKQLTNT